MRWVKLTLPWPLRLRYPLITLRLTSSNLAGMSRKLVAVGTDRLRSMLAAMATLAPRMGSPTSSATTGVVLAPGPVDRAGTAGAATADPDAPSDTGRVDGDAVAEPPSPAPKVTGVPPR